MDKKKIQRKLKRRLRKMEIKQYEEMYKDLLEKFKSENVALKLIEQFGLDKRTEFIAEYKANEPATELQKKFIKDLIEQKKVEEGIDLNGLSKEKAREIISEAKKIN